MKLHNVIQGSPEWHALRNRVKHTASELPVIRGNSKYKARTDAIREAATGIKPEVSDFMQAKFDEGHATEAKARVIIEAMIGDDLYPSTATTDDEYLLASCDGSTMTGELGYEHKLWNKDLAAAIRDSNEYGTCRIPTMYTDQMDQLIAVFGFEKIVFVTSDGTADNMEWMYYHGDAESIARIRADWAQFDIDVANYQHVEVAAKPILAANPIDNLPALFIEVTGRVTSSNLVEFKAAATAVISSIKTELVNDQDFVDATAAVKYLKDVEDSAKRAKQNALDQTTSIADLHRALDEVAKMAGDVRKALDKKITEEKDRRKADIVMSANQELVNHIMKMNERIGAAYMPRIDGGFGEAVKGLKSLDSMRDKVTAALANAKVEANEIADRIACNIKSLETNGENWRFLFPDLSSVCLKASDDFAALLAARKASHKAAEDQRLEAERENIRAEEQAKAQREAAQKAAAEAAEFNRVEQERKAAEQAKAFAESMPSVPNSEKAHTEVEAITASNHIEQPLVMVESVVKESLTTDETIKLGEICTRLGFTVTADFLASLGIHPVATDKNAKLYPAIKFPTICRLIQEHIGEVILKSLCLKKAA